MKTIHFAKRVLTVAGMLALGSIVPTAFGQTAGQDQSTPPAASQPQPGMHKHGENGEGPFAGLNLTDDQKAQIKKIHMDAKAKADAAMSDSALSDADKKAKVHEIHRAAMMEARKVLTPEQRAQLKENRKERKAEKAATNPS